MATYLLTPGELRFYKEGLLPAVGDRYLISFKVRLGDVITVANWNGSYGRKIAQKHVDFVLVSPGSSRIVAAIELNDGSHLTAKRRARDAFFRCALKSAAIPLILFPSTKRTSRRRLLRELTPNVHGLSRIAESVRSSRKLIGLPA